MNEFDERVSLTNEILMKLGANFRIQKIDEINSKLFVSLYRLIFKVIPEGIIENETGRDIPNIKIILNSLSRDIIHVSLNHIDAEKVVKADPSSIMNILEIFQGLVNCIYNRKPLHTENIGNENVKKLRKVIRDTNIQADNLAMITKQRYGKQSERERYLQMKIEELLGRFGGLAGCGVPKSGGDCLLMEYVNDHEDRVTLMRDRCFNDSSRRGNAKSGQICANGRIECDDDLTVVTGNEGHETATERCSDGSDVSRCSGDTYLVSVPLSTDDRHSPVDVVEDGRVRDAWAQVNKDLIHDGYEAEFLSMLMAEDDNLDRDRRPLRCDEERSLSAFEDDSGPRSDCRRSVHTARNTVGIRSGGGGGLVRPVIRHIGGHSTQRSDLGSVTCRSHRSADDDNDSDDMMTRLLREFPGVTISDQTLRQLWSQAARQAANIHRVQREFVSRLGSEEQRVQDARRRQQLLFTLLRKEALHQARLKQRIEERESQYNLKASKDKQRQQSAKAKRYYDEFAQRQRARMLQKQAREEQVFRTMFNAALKLQRERINDLRRYAKDKKTEKFSQHQKDLDSLENHYRDRFSMLADCLRGERRQLDLQDKSREQALHRQKAEIRLNMERDIRMLHESMVRSDHEIYFRELDANNAVQSSSMVTTSHK